MNPSHTVISDFLDGEAFDPRALGEALADPVGREVLIDFVVLRYAVQADDPVVAEPLARWRPTRLLFATAAALVALVGGYQLGHRQAGPDSTQPPVATRVVPVDWHSVPEESAR
jgi:hypothetical protein